MADKDLNIQPKPSNSKPVHMFIPDAMMVALQGSPELSKNERHLIDPYLTGLVEDEKETNVDPRQYTVFQENKVEEPDPSVLGEALTRYGGSSDRKPQLQDLVVFKPERMALHWVAILAAMYVKTDAALPQNPANSKLHSGDYNEWVDARDTDYVNKVNEIYFKLLGIDHTLDKRFKDDTPWDGTDLRKSQLIKLCKDIRIQTDDAVDAYVNNRIDKSLTTKEKEKIDTAIKKTSNKTTQKKESRKIAIHWVKNEIYRDLVNEVICSRMEEWFKNEVLNTKKEKRYTKKQYFSEGNRESFVLSGGSATGKSVPMAMVCQKLAEGYDKESNKASVKPDEYNWKHGLDLNDAVHMKSEVMRSLLLEPEFLNYGNRLFFDESAHDERRIIRDEMFKYLEKMLKNKADPALTQPKTGPVIIHDRRSTYQHETDILARNGQLNYYHFNVPAEEALKRNRGRGAYDLKNITQSDFNLDVSTYTPRFVNARNNINSQASAASRTMEMIENHAGEDIVLPLYSTKVKEIGPPSIFGAADLLHKIIYIRRVPRLIEMIDNSHFIPSENHMKHPGPLPIDSVEEIPKEKERTPEQNAERAAQWLAGLSRYKDYRIYISTPPVEKKTDRPNEQFVEIRPATKIGKPPMLIKSNPAIYKNIQKKDDKKEGGSSRYEAFLRALEKATKLDENPEAEADYEAAIENRIKRLLFQPDNINAVDGKTRFGDFVKAQRTKSASKEMLL